MTRSDLIKETRSVVADTSGPNFGWSDLRLAYWLSEGQDKFCERTGFWVDRKSYKVTLVENQQEYVIDSRIISILSIWDGTRQLVDASKYAISDLNFADIAAQKPNSYRLDLATGFITFLEPVAAAGDLQLSVHRKSLIPLSTSGENPAIPEEFHLALVEYAAYKAFGDHDRELQDPVKSGEHYKNFLAYVKDGSKAYRRLTGDYADVIPSSLYVV